VKIVVTYGVGEGLTKIAAFDHALCNAGIGNYNLIKISSIVPKNAEIVVQKLNLNHTEIGYKLYVVLANSIEDVAGKEAWAGLAWMRTESNGHGVFVEQAASTRKKCIALIKKSLRSVAQYRLEKHGEIHTKLCGMKCKKDPVCAVVAAVYESECWREN